MELAGQVVVNGVMLSLVYILVALGLTLVYSMMNILNFAHGAVYMVAAYLLFAFSQTMGMDYWLSAFLSILLTAILGVLIERTVIKPVRTQGLTPFLTTFGMAMILGQGVVLVFGANDKTIPSVFQGSLTASGITVSMERLFLIAAAAVLTIGFYLFLFHTKPGLAMRATGQNTEAAALQGIDPNLAIAISMLVGSALAAAAAVLMAPVFSVNANMGFMPMFKGFIICILGGVGSFSGCFIAGFMLGFIDSLGATFIGYEYASILGFALLMIMLIVKPAGLMEGA